VSGEYCERQRPDRGAQAVGHRARRLDGHDAAGGERLLRVVGTAGLGSPHLGVRRQRRCRDRRTREQSTTADGCHDDVEVRHLLQQLARRGALTGDHHGIVVRVDQHGTGLFEEPRRRLLARLQRRRARDHDGAEVFHRSPLRARRSLRHHDPARDAAQPRRARQRRAVVA